MDARMREAWKQRQAKRGHVWLVATLLSLAVGPGRTRAADARRMARDPARAASLQAAVLSEASRLLDEAEVSYVYGGSTLGDEATCDACNTCLASRHPRPDQRLKRCPECARCSLDCSHFTALVFKRAGAPYPYLETAAMLSLSGTALRRRYHLIDLGRDLDRAAPGDLLVYDGHVVLLERLDPPVPGRPLHRGDVVAATGGHDIRRPGEGIQRERFVDLATFRGPLRRILRHELLDGVPPSKRQPAVALPNSPEPNLPGTLSGTGREAALEPAAASVSPSPTVRPLRRLKPVAKRHPNGR